MIATEAAAEGLTFDSAQWWQYDLPWNPERIEQRIGAAIATASAVVVVNIFNKNMPPISACTSCSPRRFKLFSGVLGASDEVLSAIESSVEFEKRIVSI